MLQENCLTLAAILVKLYEFLGLLPQATTKVPLTYEKRKCETHFRSFSRGQDGGTGTRPHGCLEKPDFSVILIIIK